MDQSGLGFWVADGGGDRVEMDGGFVGCAGVRLYRIGVAGPKVGLGLPVVIESPRLFIYIYIYILLGTCSQML
jgi:hypothetical protein